MTIVTHELGLVSTFNEGGRLRQLITVKNESLDVGAMRPHLYRHLSPAGSVLLRVTDLDGKKIGDSETIALSALGAGENYFHGKWKFLIQVSLRRLTQYYIELVGSGYTYDPAAFVGWCTDFDLRNNAAHDVTGSDGDGINSPFAFELWAYKQAEKGITR